jgi:site-specific DNA-methyltransferase (adenine-specific)
MLTWIVTTKMAKTNRLKPAHEPIMVAQKPYVGSIAHNEELYGTGRINTEQARVPWDKMPKQYPANGIARRSFGKGTDSTVTEYKEPNANGRFPSNVIGHFDVAEHQKYFYAPRVSSKERGEYNDHPTPKPISLMRYLVDIYAPQAGVVLDPFMGSGSTGIATIQSGRAFVGIDQCEQYVEISERRIADHCSSYCSP